MAAKWESSAAAALRESIAQANQQLAQPKVLMEWRSTAKVPASMVEQWLDDGWELVD